MVFRCHRSTVFWVSRFPLSTPSFSIRPGSQKSRTLPFSSSFVLFRSWGIFGDGDGVAVERMAYEFWCVYVILCKVRKTRRKTSTVCKRERENKKRNKCCLYCFPLFEFVFGKWCGCGGGVE